MILRNETKSVQQFGIPGRHVKGEPAPAHRLLQIPAGATVEVEDADWELITSSVVRAQIYEDVQEKIGTEEFGQAKIGKERLTKTVRVPTGRYHRVNLVNEMVKEGRLTVVEAPKSNLTVEQLVARINLVKGFAVNADDFSVEELEEVYLQNKTRIDEAVALRKSQA